MPSAAPCMGVVGGESAGKLAGLGDGAASLRSHFRTLTLIISDEANLRQHSWPPAFAMRRGEAEARKASIR